MEVESSDHLLIVSATSTTTTPATATTAPAPAAASAAVALPSAKRTTATDCLAFARQ